VGQVRHFLFPRNLICKPSQTCRLNARSLIVGVSRFLVNPMCKSLELIRTDFENEMAKKD